ncbi:MAG: hypothetical protein ACXABD_20330 [Candidatus Thorarchaeota archaeon]
MQRVGLDTTIAGWDKQLANLKKQFPIFSKKEFTDAASLAALMTREFGFTEAQIADLVKQSAILSEITGKDLNEAVRGVTFAIGSGYFESLQRAGINISRQVVANKALELGYDAVYNELEPVIRASITYAVIQDNLNAIQEDAGKIVETTRGATLRLNASWKDFLITLGRTVTESETAKEAVEGLARSVELLTEAMELLNSLSDEEDRAGLPRFFAFMVGLAPRTEELEAFNEQMGVFVNWLREMQGIREPILDDLVDEDTLDALEKFEIGGVEFSEEEYQEIVDATAELAEEIEKIEEESFKRRQDALDKFQDESADKFQAHIQKILDIQQDLNRKLADITLKAEQRTSDEIANNAFRTQEVIRKAAFRREDAERKFREREISAERKFQEKLRQLRENFLLDLEDAVRERDARQIIRLTRQFNLRRTQMVREEKLNKTDRTAQFQEELKQIERQKNERLRQLAIEHQRRLEDIARQAERERAQARIDAERRTNEENLRFEREKADREERQEEILNAIEEEKQERITAFIQGLQEQYGLTKEQLDAFSLLWKDIVGPDGEIVGWVETGVAQVQAHMLQLAQFMNRLRTLMGAYLPGGKFQDPLRKEKDLSKFFFDPIRREKEFDFAGGQAEGGTIIARKPTVAVFGEAGTEAATFTPLNRLGSVGGAAITPMNAGNMSRDGRIRLEMLLSPDLEARVVDNTLGEIADINFAIERARK